MHSLRNPKWVFLINTMPVVLLLLLCYGEFSVIHTLLPAISVQQWQAFGAVLALLGTGAAGYATVQALRRQPLGAWYSVLMLLIYSLWLCLLTTHDHDLLPWGDVPRWMLPTDPLLMAWTFLMPTLAHSLLALVAKFTSDDRPQSAIPNFLFAVATPVGWVIIFQVLSWIDRLVRTPYTGPSRWADAETVLLVAMVVLSTLSFFFFLVRALLIITQRRNGFWADTSLVWKVIITTLLPLLGLGVNNGLFFGQGFREENGIFGNFSSPWFYLLAVLNGALLCLPDSDRALPRLLQLLGRSVLFGYTFYFFLVFLPFLPLSIPAILLIGTGFLLLAPTMLFVVHVRQLSEDVTVVRVLYSRATAVLVLVVGLATLPLSITAEYWHRRQVLHEALAYVYTPNYAQPNRVEAAALARTLDVIRQNKAQGQSLLGSHLPYLSTYFNWLVLDNLMLSESKLNDLNRIFTGTGRAWPNDDVRSVATADDQGVVLRHLRTSSRYDARQQAWVSWVRLEVANRDTTVWNREYHTTLTLPPGCWVSDYYLTIGNRQERGILAEKRAASWVFAQIQNENRDPGLLAYRGPNDIDLRVFPVTKGQARRTSIQLLHKEPCTLMLDGHTFTLGDSTTAPPVAAPVATADSGVVYLSALVKQSLPLVQRRPYYHFLVDASAGATHLADFKTRMVQQLAQPLPNGAPARFSLVDAYTTPVPVVDNWDEQLRRATPQGGFFLTGAIRQVLFAAQEHPAPTYPVLVVVTDNLDNAVLDADFEEFSSAYPESDAFYVLGPDGRLVPHSLRHQSRRESASVPPTPGASAAVRAWPNAAHPRAYLPATNTADVVLNQPQAVPTAQTVPATRWLTGLLLRGYSQWQNFHPETTDRERVPFIQASFRAGIMTPFTSFLALENDAQKAALNRKQAETLAANASLDTLEDDNAGATAVPLDGGAVLLLVAGVLLACGQLRRFSRFPRL